MSAIKTLETAVGAEIVIDGQRFVNFGGSSYLGLAANPEILKAGVEALQSCGSGAPMPGTHGVATRALQEVEAEATRYFLSESAVYLSSGYCVGLALLAAVRSQFQIVFYDEVAHYALRDGIAACGLPAHSYHHCDPQDLSGQVRKYLRPGMRPLVVTDGLYSTFGVIPPLAELAAQVACYDGRLIVDESHSFGVLGAQGRGALEHCAIDSALAFAGGSLGKGFGTCGGVIPTTHERAVALRVTPVALGAALGLTAGAAMCARSLKYVREHPELLQRLRHNTRYVKDGLRALGLAVKDDVVPIAAFETGAVAPERIKRALMAEGIHVYHSTYIGAGAGGVIRIGIFADHIKEHLDRLLQALRRLL